MKFETTPKHSSASNPAERAIQAVEETISDHSCGLPDAILAELKHLARTNRSGHGCCVVRDGKSVDTNRRATE